MRLSSSYFYCFDYSGSSFKYAPAAVCPQGAYSTVRTTPCSTENLLASCRQRDGVIERYYIGGGRSLDQIREGCSREGDTLIIH